MPQLAFAVFVLAVFAYGLIDSARLSFLGGVFPTATAGVDVAFSLLFLVWRIATGPAGHPSHYDQEVAAHVTGAADGTSQWPSIGWFVLLFGLAALIGFILAIAIFIPAFLLSRTQIGVVRTVIYAAACIGFMVFLGHMLTLDFPAGLLQKYVELPWPLR